MSSGARAKKWQSNFVAIFLTRVPSESWILSLCPTFHSVEEEEAFRQELVQESTIRFLCYYFFDSGEDFMES
jgi:hypothetical protein